MIYLVDLAKEKDFSSWDFLLENIQNKEEIKNISLLKNKKRRIVWECLLKIAASKENIHKVNIKRNDFGKPYLMEQPGFKFNVSHSKDIVAFISSNEEIGIDVEAIRDINFNGISKRFFSPSEYEYITNGGRCETEIQKKFYKIWTLKESYIKMLGKGMAISLRSFSVADRYGIKQEIAAFGSEKSCYLFNIGFLEGYELSVCCLNKDIDRRYEWISLSDLQRLSEIN